MPKAKKLPSGAWQTYVYSHTEGGKRKYMSFTAGTKAEAELKAAEYKANKKRQRYVDITVGEAIDRYIESKSGILSPSTLREYLRSAKHDLDELRPKKIKNLTSEDLQLFVTHLTIDGKSEKTIRNNMALVRASVALFQPDINYRVSLPPKKVSRPVSPSDEAIQALLDNSQGNLHKAILLGIRGMRRGEICALMYEDIQNGFAHIHADMIMDSDKKWIIKERPKTEGSDRTIRVPDLGEGTGRVVTCTPGVITNHFARLRDKLGISIRFHDLRHYFASTAAVLNIPDIYTADFGGWSRAGNAPVMKSVYQNNIKSMSDYYADKLEEHLQKFDRKSAT